MKRVVGSALWALFLVVAPVGASSSAPPRNKLSKSALLNQLDQRASPTRSSTAAKNTRSHTANLAAIHQRFVTRDMAIRELVWQIKDVDNSTVQLCRRVNFDPNQIPRVADTPRPAPAVNSTKEEPSVDPVTRELQRKDDRIAALKVALSLAGDRLAWVRHAIVAQMNVDADEKEANAAAAAEALAAAEANAEAAADSGKPARDPIEFSSARVSRVGNKWFVSFTLQNNTKVRVHVSRVEIGCDDGSTELTFPEAPNSSESASPEDDDELTGMPPGQSRKIYCVSIGDGYNSGSPLRKPTHLHISIEDGRTQRLLKHILSPDDIG